jgi:hypothetical protein
MGNKLRALLRLVDQLFDSDSDPVGQGTVQTTVAVPTTNVGIRRKTTTGMLTDTTKKHFFIGFQFPR